MCDSLFCYPEDQGTHEQQKVRKKQKVQKKQKARAQQKVWEQTWVLEQVQAQCRLVSIINVCVEACHVVGLVYRIIDIANDAVDIASNLADNLTTEVTDCTKSMTDSPQSLTKTSCKLCGTCLHFLVLLDAVLNQIGLCFFEISSNLIAFRNLVGKFVEVSVNPDVANTSREDIVKAV
ncbi:hypothetical protein KCU81_g567, partial [Aureobasidium melanogenum]